MHRYAHRCIFCLLVALNFTNTAQAIPLPQGITNSLQQREERLSHFTYEWQLVDNQHILGLSPEQLATQKKAMETGWAARYRKEGITDEKLLRQYAQGATRDVIKFMGGGAVTYSNIWKFERDGPATLLTGTVQSLTDYTSTYRQYYNGDAALVVADSIHSTNGKSFSTFDPAVWGGTTESVRYASPVPQGLETTPEHLAMLANFNPIAVYGAEWSLTATTPDAWVITAQAMQNGYPITLQETLSRKYNAAPSEILTKGVGFSYSVHVRHFRQYQGEWIADQVDYTKDAPKFASETQTWTLQSINPSQPLTVVLSGHRPVHDYRLLGQNLSERTINNAERKGHNRDIVYYPWKGQFPSREELMSIHNKDHPGEATPDPKQASSLPFAGGLMMLVGGVWMFRRRGSAS